MKRSVVAVIFALVPAFGCNAVLGMDEPQRAPTTTPLPTCSDTQVDCNADPTDGCEANLDKDPKHCGACGFDCLGGGCEAAQCQGLVLAQVGIPGAIALTTDYVVWIDEFLNELNRVSKNGTGQDKRAELGGEPRRVTTHGDFAYVTSDDKLLRIGVPDGTSGKTVLATDLATPFGLAIGGDVLYVSAHGDENVQDGSILHMSLPDGDLSVLVDELIDPGPIAVDNNKVYWIDNTALKVASAPRAGGPAVELATIEIGKAFDLLVEGDRLYFSIDGGGTIYSLPVTGGTPDVFTGFPEGPKGLASDGTYLFWAERDLGMISRRPFEGGLDSAVAVGLLEPKFIAIDEEAIFFSDRTAATIAKVPMP